MSAFDKVSLTSGAGLPRGLSISSTLAEIVMRSFDRYVSQLNGVYFYSRYVDDIIIFSHRDSGYIYTDVVNFLKEELGMILNNNKTNLIKFNCYCDELCKCTISGSCKLVCKCSKQIGCEICFEYLGYGYRLKVSADIKKPNTPVVYLSETKVKKYKSRLIHTLLSHANNPDFDLLKKRISFLTGNFFADPESDKNIIKSGIYYNYRMLTEFSALDELDKFYHKSLFSRNGSLGNKIAISLLPAQQSELVRYSFKSGYANKILHKFTRSDMAKIKECWQA
ncbi:RNA-directed DNA polymerase [Geobacter grbiciae]|nr:RNA-directed DNA polymerase [Geobacter grbiciae]